MAVRINGSNKSLRSSLNPAGSQTSYSFCGWFKISSDRDDNSGLMGFDGGSDSNAAYLELQSDGRVVRAVFNTDASDGSYTMTVGTWYFLAVSVSGDNVAWYRKTLGSTSLTLVDTDSVSDASPKSMTHLRLMQFTDNSSEWTNGCITGARYWNSALTSTELNTESRQLLHVRTANIIASYPLITHTDLADASGNGRHLSAGSSSASTESGPSGIPLTVNQTLDSVGGIGSGVALGDATLTASYQIESAGGIDSAQALGDVSVEYSINPTGIPTAEAFGFTTADDTARPAGIPSTVAFGEATVTPGPVTIDADGIPAPSPQFGIGTVLGSVLNPVGIADTLVWGTAIVTPGPVTLSDAGGIAHAHPFGHHEVIRLVSALTSEIVIRPRPRTSYELILVARIPQPWDPPIFMELEALSWNHIKYGQKLSTPDTLDASVKVSSLTEPVKQRLRTPSEIASELWLYRNGKRVFGGPLIGGSLSGEDLTLHANGCLEYLQWMHLRSDMIFKNTDQFTIVKAMIDQWGGDTYGNFGIDTSNVGLSGINLDATYVRAELDEVWDRVMDLAKSEVGFDIAVDPVNRSLELYYPYRGVDRSIGSEAVIFDDRNVTDTNIAFSLGPRDLATVVAGVGTGSGQDQIKTFWSAWQNSERMARVGRIGYTSTFQGVTTQVQNDNLALALLRARDETLWVPGPNVRVTPDADLETYDVGDTVAYHLHNELDIKGAFRMLARNIDVDENSNENVSVTFV